jgi:hypothetical protein
MPNDVFISYRRKDSEFVQQLHQELTNRGISAWFDKESIEVADHWRTSIAEGIRECKVFVLVLSPDAVESVNIRKEVDLAESHHKKIVPLVWRKTDIPVAFEYALAGIQWIDFNETASSENFDELADVVNRLLGGSSMSEATSDKQTAKESTIPPLEKEAAPPADTGRKLGGRRKLGLKKKQTVNPMVIGGSVISGVVTTFDLGVEDQDFVNGELKWLFNAADNLMKIHLGEVESNQSVTVPIPEEAERDETANNQLLSAEDEYGIQFWGQLESKLKRIDSYLRNLNILLDKEAMMGPDARGDVHLQNQLKDTRLQIVKALQEMAQLMNQAYGIFVTSPDQLNEFLA